MLDLDAVLARHEAAIRPESETALGQYKPAIASVMDVPDLVAELRAARAFERFIRDHADTIYTRALTLVESWDRLVASGDAYAGSEEES